MTSEDSETWETCAGLADKMGYKQELGGYLGRTLASALGGADVGSNGADVLASPAAGRTEGTSGKVPDRCTAS